MPKYSVKLRQKGRLVFKIFKAADDNSLIRKVLYEENCPAPAFDFQQLPMLKTWGGKVSAYGFKCGHVETYAKGDNNKAELYHEGCYHVRLIKADPSYNLQWNVGEAKKWLAFETLGEARKCFNQFKKEL